MSVWSNFSCSSCQPGSAKGPSIQTLAAAQSSATGNDVQKAALAKLFCRAFLLFPRVLPFLKALLPFPRALPFPRHCLFSRHMHSSVLHFLEAFCTCWLLYHGPIVTVNLFYALVCWSTWRKPKGDGRKKNLRSFLHLFHCQSCIEECVLPACQDQLSSFLGKLPKPSALHCHLFSSHSWSIWSFSKLSWLLLASAFARSLSTSASSTASTQLLVLCNRTAVHNMLLHHGFHNAWSAASVSLCIVGGRCHIPDRSYRANGVRFHKWWPQKCHWMTRRIFFRPSPLSFRQVDQHAVACSLLIKAIGKLCQPSWCKDGPKSPCQWRTRYTVLWGRLNAKTNKKNQTKTRQKQTKATTKQTKHKTKPQQQTKKKDKRQSGIYRGGPTSVSILHWFSRVQN